MFLDVSVKDMINIKPSKVNFNEVIITRRDVVRIQKLMQYLSDHHIHFDEELRLDSLIPIQQNEIGLIFFEYYEYLIIKSGVRYLNRTKFREMFSESETIMSYLDRSEALAPSGIDNALTIRILTTKQLNEIVLNWFNVRHRNFRSIEKNIEITNNLYDINLNAGHFNKVTDKAEFLGLMFSRFIRTAKGSIPFSGHFGSSIKESLHKKADYFTKKIILEEVSDFVESLAEIYAEDFKLINIEYIEEPGIATKLTVRVTLEAAKDEIVQFELQ